MKGKLTVARFLCALGLGVWLGGIAFAGSCAPILFHVAEDNGVKAVAPQMFGLMLQRFQFIAGACAILALLGWGLEKPLPGYTSRPRQLWVVQGALTASMLGITLYMGVVMFPRMNSLQREFLPQFKVAAGVKPHDLNLPIAKTGDPVRAEFEALHVLITRLTMSVFWMGVLALAAFTGRTAASDVARTTQRRRGRREAGVAVP